MTPLPASVVVWFLLKEFEPATPLPVAFITAYCDALRALGTGHSRRPGPAKTYDFERLRP